jgi:hypothetical protein
MESVCNALKEAATAGRMARIVVSNQNIKAY